MSLKSFDKFCESLILNEPKSRKEIFDERQRQVRSRLTTEALGIYGGAVLINTFVMETVYKWCDSYTAPMALLMVICIIYWTVRNGVKGTLFGVNGTFSGKFSGWYGIFMGVMLGSSVLLGLEDGEGFINDGALTKNLVGLISCVLVFAYGIIMLVLAKRDDRRREAAETAESESDNSDE